MQGRTSAGAEDWDRRYAEAGLVWSAEPNRFVAAALEHVPPGRALDLAAGEGRNAVWLARRGWAVTAVDFSAVGLDKGRDLAAEHGVEVEWVCADLAAWTPPPEAFDAVVIAYLQVGEELLRTVLGDAAAALAPGGRLVVVGHDRRNLIDGYGGPQHPAVLYTAEDLVAMLDGLQVEQAGPVERPVDSPEGPRTAIDTLVLARR